MSPRLCGWLSGPDRALCGERQPDNAEPGTPANAGGSRPAEVEPPDPAWQSSVVRQKDVAVAPCRW